jgi:hypothetical protein
MVVCPFMEENIQTNRTLTSSASFAGEKEK